MSHSAQGCSSPAQSPIWKILVDLTDSGLGKSFEGEEEGRQGWPLGCGGWDLGPLKIFIYVFERQGKRASQRDLSYVGLLPKWLQPPDLGQEPGPPSGSLRAGPGAMLSQEHRRKLDRKWSSGTPAGSMSARVCVCYVSPTCVCVCICLSPMCVYVSMGLCVFVCLSPVCMSVCLCFCASVCVPRGCWSCKRWLNLLCHNIDWGPEGRWIGPAMSPPCAASSAGDRILRLALTPHR